MNTLGSSRGGVDHVLPRSLKKIDAREGGEGWYEWDRLGKCSKQHEDLGLCYRSRGLGLQLGYPLVDGARPLQGLKEF